MAGGADSAATVLPPLPAASTSAATRDAEGKIMQQCLQHDDFHLPNAAGDAWREADATGSIICNRPDPLRAATNLHSTNNNATLNPHDLSVSNPATIHSIGIPQLLILEKSIRAPSARLPRC